MATNPNNAFGFKPVKHLNGSPFNGAGQLCFIPSGDSNATFVGDVVKLVLPSAADTLGYGVPQVTVAGATDVPYGVVVGADPVLGVTTPNLYVNYRLASVGQYVYVVNATDAIFAVQLDGASAASDIGKNANLATGSGSTVSGLSGYVLHSASINTTNTLQWHILGLSLIPQGNTLGLNFAVYEVVANIHALAFSTAGV